MLSRDGWLRECCLPDATCTCISGVNCIMFVFSVALMHHWYKFMTGALSVVPLDCVVFFVWMLENS